MDKYLIINDMNWIKKILGLKTEKQCAKLITAAPDLLEAAKMAYTAIRHETNPSNSQLDAYFKLEKAINKALGKNI